MTAPSTDTEVEIATPRSAQGDLHHFAGHAVATASAALVPAFQDAAPFAPQRVFPYVHAQDAVRRLAARKFAEIALSLNRVTEVWLTETAPELRLTAIVDELDFEAELQLRTIFIQLMSNGLGPGVGELSVHAENDGVPEWAREGTFLS